MSSRVTRATPHRRRGHRGAARPSTTRSSSMPARRLDEHDVAGREAVAERADRGRASATTVMALVREAGRAGAVDDPGGRCARCAVHDDEQVERSAPAASPTSRWPASWASQLAHLAQDGDVTAGQAGQQLERRASPSPATRCRRRRRCDAAGADDDRAMRRAGPRRPARGRSRRAGCPAASPAAAAASALWTASLPSAGIRTSRSPAGVTSRNAIPSSPSERDVGRRGRRRPARSRRSITARPGASGHPRGRARRPR